ncbi:unnamed protein product [Rhizophagus irregularis]|nr:unnamed protein product [Rhizophagus irregularis]
MMDNKKHNFSPHPSPLIKFGQINVNGLCSPVRQQHLLNFFLHSSFGVLSLNDTRFTPSSAKFIFKNEQSQYNFRSYWACSSSSRPHDGVGILLRYPLHKHVQTIDSWEGRLIKIDLFFHQTKISLISLYNPPSGSVHYNDCSALIVKLTSWLDYARSHNYHVIILGDFNIDEISHSSYSPRHFRLTRLLTSRYFIDHQSHFLSSTNPDNTYFHNGGASRLDYIWSSPGFPAPALFSHVTPCPDLSDRPFTDHHVLITVFDFSSCLAILAKSRLKQKKEGRVIFAYNSANEDQWINFSSEVNSHLYLDFNISGPYADFDFSRLSLDKLWHSLKRVILGAAIEYLPKKTVSNTFRHSYPPDLTKLIAINKFLDKLLFRLTTSRPSRPTQLQQLISALPRHLKDLTTLIPDFIIPTYSTSPLSAFKSFLRSQKSLVSAYLSVRFAQHTSESIEYYTALRDDYFSSSPGTFIDSALSVEQRSIVLDRVLVVLDSKPTLLTDPTDIKQAAVAHFQSVVSPPLTQYTSRFSFPARWQKVYAPLDNVSASLYDPVLSPISLQEWSEVISSMPNNKASGPSKISYEMLKHLSGDALEFSLLLANSCLSRGDIPADWREAVVYPIPKPHDFDAQLKNTRPITLLETVRKCVVKVVTNRLSRLLADNKILQGGNFAGLPGGSTDVPIKMLDAIIHQHKYDPSDDQELWIVSQDISKAFDSMDLNMLKLALERLQFPALLVRFILNLFTRRNNKIITCHGDTPRYRVRVGIDQGEIISPLLWVIYLDPLLTVLNQEASDPFILKSSALLDYAPLEFEQHSLPVSHLTFMDDSTLIASSKSGIEDRLSITAEFYTLNNVQANSAKYVLLSSSSPSSTVSFAISPSPLVFNSNLTLTSLALNTSFRFLGVWFSLSASSQFVLKQARSMVKDMAALLAPKKLLAQHIAYLYNVVLLPRLEFRLQTSLFSEPTVQSIISPMLSLLKKKAGLASTTPLALLYLKIPFSIQHAFCRFLSSHVASWQKIFTHPDFRDFAGYAISYLQGFLGAESCPTAIDLTPWSQVHSLRSHSLFNSLFFSSRLNVTWSLPFRPPRRDLRPAIPLRSLIPQKLFQTSWRLWKNLNLYVLAQLSSPCGKFLLQWPDLRYLGIVGKKGRIPAWFKFLINNILSSISSFSFFSSYIINSAFILASPLLLDIVPDGQYRPQWALSLDRITQTLLVGRVCMSYSKKGHAIMSHWLPPSDPNSVEFTPCPGCSRHVPKYASLSHIKRRCTSESCFTKVLLLDTVAYPTKKNTKVFATGRLIKLATSFAYASSLAKIHFDRMSNPVVLPSFGVEDVDDSDYMLPSSTCTLYTDGSFLTSRSGSLPSMFSAWLALDEDNLILESCSEVIPATYPSAFRSEIYALLSALKALPPHSSVVINTDCAPLISFWHQFIDKPFIPKLLRQPNHLLWLSVRHYFYTKQLSVTFQKVSAHSENLLNNQVDSLAKDAHFFPQPTFTPITLLKAPCIILYDSLPVEDNIRHFFKSIYEARNLLSFSSLSRFSLLAPVDTFDWEGIFFWLSRSKVFTTHNNGHKGLLAFRLKILLDMLPTLTALQKRDPSSYPSDWLCALCHSAPEDLDHLWTCPYIIPDASPRLIFQKLMLAFRDECITQFSDISPPSDQFLLEFSALDCWDFTTPSSPCLWLARGLLPVDLVQLLQQLYSKKKIFEILSLLLLDFQDHLYWDIWMPRNVFFHLWLDSQEHVPKRSSTSSSSSSFIPSSSTSGSSLATVSQDSWFTWISSSIIRGGSWISHLDFLRRLTVQPLRISLW